VRRTLFYVQFPLDRPEASEKIIMRMNVLTATLVWLCIATVCQSATIIHAGRLIDGRSELPRSEMTIVVEEGRIARVESGYLPLQEGDRLIELREHTVMPGLMDMHTHLMSQHSKDCARHNTNYRPVLANSTDRRQLKPELAAWTIASSFGRARLITQARITSLRENRHVLFSDADSLAVDAGLGSGGAFCRRVW
jgi:predicted amidohydrolase YtcJ